jgi:hypothetical protein
MFWNDKIPQEFYCVYIERGAGSSGVSVDYARWPVEKVLLFLFSTIRCPDVM